MGDKCVCGHEEREHGRPPTLSRPVPDCADAPHGDCWHDDCQCLTYRRSPLSAFRGPAVTWTRAEASAALLLLNCGGAAYAVRNLDPDQLRDVVRLYVQSARANATAAPDLAAVQFLAARILRAVRP